MVARGNARAHWQNARKTLLELLHDASCFDTKVASRYVKQGFGNHARYLKRLQLGAVMHKATNDVWLDKRVAIEAKAAAALVAENKVVHTVDAAHQLASTEIWKQGDASLATEKQLRMRFKLRHEPAIHAVHAAFWDVMMRATGRPGDDLGETVRRSDYFALFERVYTVLLDDWDSRDAEETISEDWDTDRNGNSLGLTYEAFGDCLFELADHWVLAVNVHTYAEFLWSLLKQLTQGDLELHLRKSSEVHFDPSLAPADHGAKADRPDAGVGEGSAARDRSGSGTEDARSKSGTGNGPDDGASQHGGAADNKGGDDSGDGSGDGDRAVQSKETSVGDDSISKQQRGGGFKAQKADDARRRQRAATKIQARSRTVAAKADSCARKAASMTIQAGLRGSQARRAKEADERRRALDHADEQARDAAAEKWSGEGDNRAEPVHENLAFGSTRRRSTLDHGQVGSGGAESFVSMASWGATTNPGQGWVSASPQDNSRPFSAATLKTVAAYSPSKQPGRPSSAGILRPREASRGPREASCGVATSEGGCTRTASSSSSSGEAYEVLDRRRDATLSTVSEAHLVSSCLELRDSINASRPMTSEQATLTFTAYVPNVPNNLKRSSSLPIVGSWPSPGAKRKPKTISPTVQTFNDATIQFMGRKSREGSSKVASPPSRRSLSFEQAVSVSSPYQASSPHRALIIDASGYVQRGWDLPNPVLSLPVDRKQYIRSVPARRNPFVSFEVRGRNYHKQPSLTGLIRYSQPPTWHLP